MAKPIWINLNKISGSNNDSVTAITTKYEGRTNREGTIRIKATGIDLYEDVTITQKGTAFIIVNPYTPTIPGNIGSSFKLTGKSNLKNIYFTSSSDKIRATTLTVNSKTIEGWDGKTNVDITNDPGATDSYTFELLISVNANNSDSQQAYSLTLGEKTEGLKQTIEVTQSAGEKTYADPVISTLTYPEAKANANTISPTIVYSQTWGWNGSTSGGGTINSGASFKYSIDADPQLPVPELNTNTGNITFSTLDTTATSASEYTVNCTITLNEKTATKRVTVHREANTATYGNATLNIENPLSVANTGGTLDVVLLITDAFSQTVSYTSGATRNGSATLSSTKVTYDGLNAGFVTIIDNRKLQYQANDTIYDRTQKIIVTVNGEGDKVAAQNINFVQRKSNATLSVVPSTLTFESAGGEQTLTIKSNVSWTVE